MGAFVVFGSSRTAAKKKAEREVIYGFDKKLNRMISLAEWRDRVEARAKEIFGTAKESPISPEFDAPQFCEDWIRIAKNSIRGECIKKRITEIDESTGKKTYHWEPL